MSLSDSSCPLLAWVTVSVEATVVPTVTVWGISGGTERAMPAHAVDAPPNNSAHSISAEASA